MAVPLAFGFVRPVHSPWIRLTRSVNPFRLSRKDRFSVSRHGSCRWNHIVDAWLRSSSVGDSSGAQISIDQSETIFIGTGTSEGVPRVSCLTKPDKTCPVCSKAIEPGNKNRRLNTSLLVRFPRPSGKCNILIDAGKFFYHSALRWFPTYGIRTIDVVIITHSHADAIGGLDDLHDSTNNVQPSIPIYTAKCDFEVALRPDRSSSTHFGLPRMSYLFQMERALEERKIRPKRTLFTGMMHLMDHDKVNEYLVKLKATGPRRTTQL